MLSLASVCDMQAGRLRAEHGYGSDLLYLCRGRGSDGGCRPGEYWCLGLAIYHGSSGDAVYRDRGVEVLILVHLRIGMGAFRMEVEEEALGASVRVARDVVGAYDIAGGHVDLVVAVLWATEDDTYALDTVDGVAFVVPRAGGRSAVHTGQIRVGKVRSCRMRVERADGRQRCKRGIAVG